MGFSNFGFLTCPKTIPLWPVYAWSIKKHLHKFVQKHYLVPYYTNNDLVWPFADVTVTSLDR